jgi:pimeloyl-ACP methyl ester carboxylesterase
MLPIHTPSTEAFADLFAPARVLAQRHLAHANETAQERRQRYRTLSEVSASQSTRLSKAYRERAEALETTVQELMLKQMSTMSSNPTNWYQDLMAYWQDAAERTTLFYDVVRQRGNLSVAQETDPSQPVLDFDFDVLIDGASLERPVNYSLLRIHPNPDVPTRDDRAPILIIDPRAGHGAGIGGFKPESQVGEGLAQGHPVYFAVFDRMPVSGQTLADVRDAEVHFLATIRQMHAQAPKPILIGNCQGGWASMLVAATSPELAGPVIINGAPMSYWAGNLGANPMRYLGGFGGALPAVVMADMGDGLFDGASLVSNFENLNPANSLFDKYYHLYANIDTEAERFLEFERWWGGFYLMTEPEIRWILENLFVGNKLARGQAVLGGERIDLRRIESPVIIFASHGDNITPPQQALNWIIDTYGSLDVLKVMGKRIVYMLHESIGHLGIFVSAKVAGHEHHAITETVHAIEALGPGLYEMKLEKGEDRTHIVFEHRTFEDILALSDGREKENAFKTVADMSETNLLTYERTLRPFIKAMTTPQSGEALRQAQPVRTQRRLISDRNPLYKQIEPLAETVRKNRKPVSPDNPFMALEKLHASFMRSTLDTYRDMRDALMEASFFQTFTSPVVKSAYTRGESDVAIDRPINVQNLPEVRDALSHIGEGGLAAGAIRMMLLMNRARGYIRRSRLERALNIIKGSEPFKSMAPEDITQLIRCQTLIVDLEPKLAFSSLIQVLPSAQERQDALDLVMAVSGPRETMSARALVQYMRYEGLLKPSNAEDGSDTSAANADSNATAATATPAAPRQRAPRKRQTQE